MTEKRQTRAELEAKIAELEAHGQDRLKVNEELRVQLRACQDSESATRAQFGDLKERLALAESENQRMRGYIARVQEDDVAREELVKVGDPEGEHQLVPKRKPTAFHAPVPWFGTGETARDHYREAMGVGSTQHKRPRHWVTY